MKGIILLITVSLFNLPSLATTRLNGYMKRDGTYIALHSRTSPTNIQRHNWPSKGNVNPNTDKEESRESQK